MYSSGHCMPHFTHTELSNKCLCHAVLFHMPFSKVCCFLGSENGCLWRINNSYIHIVLPNLNHSGEIYGLWNFAWAKKGNLCLEFFRHIQLMKTKFCLRELENQKDILVMYDVKSYHYRMSLLWPSFKKPLTLTIYQH